MTLILRSCKSLLLLNSSLPLNHVRNPLRNKQHASPVKLPSPKFCPFSNKFTILGATHVPLCSKNEEFVVDDRIQEFETLELLDKPSLVTSRNGSSSETDVHREMDSTEEEALALAPFVKFLKGGDDSVVEEKEDGGVLEGSKGRDGVGDECGEDEKGCAEYYEPKPGDFVVGVVVSGNENKLNVNVGSDLLGTMLTKEVLPLYSKEMEHLLCDVSKAEESFMVEGRMGIVKNDDAMVGGPVTGGTVVEIGTILFAEVLGRTLAGRPLLSTRRLFRRIAWHRLRQIKQLGEPVEVRITEWNTKGLLTRIEGLRAFLPKAELMKRVNSFSELKENEKLYLREGTLLEGTVKKILPYGAQIRIGETNRSGLLHVSDITRARIPSITNILSVGEKVKVLVVKSQSPDKISLSIADLESEPGQFLSNKERVFLEADMMAKKYREKLPPAFVSQQPESLQNSALPFENEALYANWKWFKFER
ncbi:protein PIGMENT DEFECTIVE 338, chloroplastic-like isoform X2 [Vigna umbellata]|uniref:protein PIGMENT DEFECTIVE 338, chloroplastic-like isoform X2 n=1 Tax=Vigna umbellata TaxID=87088 RepID=UPI001F5F472A|nr:protein PIGMENT DEFECTIVE 338, chloroplastic-like isoform X2 [Vigna umbellata]